MTDKKKPVTSLVAVRIEYIDTSLVPDLGYNEKNTADEARNLAKNALVKSSRTAAKGAAVTVAGLFFAGIFPVGAPFFILPMILLVHGFMDLSFGSLMSLINIHKLVRANQLSCHASDNDTRLALAEGAAHILIKTVNARAIKWNEGWDILVQEEEKLFAMHEQCVTEKSKRGLIKRIELIRKEKKKHLKVRMRIEAERKRILRGISTMQKTLDSSKEQRLLEDGEE